MTPQPGRARTHAHLLGGVECEPAPRGPIEALGAAVVAAALALTPSRFLRLVAARVSQHVSIEREECP